MRGAKYLIYKFFYYSLIPQFVREDLLDLQSPRYIRTDVFVVSFPKCGRTWLKILLGKIFQEHYDLDIDIDAQKVSRMYKRDGRVPFVRFTHDNFRSLVYDTDEYSPTPDGYYQSKKIIYLFRDPRDVTVSWYHHLSKRRQEFDGTLVEFIRNFPLGPEVIVEFYNRWSQKLEELPDAFSMRYESLHENPFEVINNLLDFLNHGTVTEEIIRDSYEFSSFDNMREMEEKEKFDSDRLQPSNPDDPNSYKTRKGKIGSYSEELTSEQIEYLNDRFQSELDDYYSQFYDFTS